MNTIGFDAVTPADMEELAALRILAMRDSLERIGRFDPDRARSRFVDGFDPANTKIILADGERVGFVVARREHGEIQLDHLYILPGHQRRGIGSAVMAELLSDADAKGLTATVGALRGSEANAFYQRFGFKPAGESEWDLFYRRPPALPAGPPPA